MDKGIFQPHWEEWLLLKEPEVHGAGGLLQECKACSHAVFLEGASCKWSHGHSKFAHPFLKVDRHLFLRLYFYRCSEAPVLSSPSCIVPVEIRESDPTVPGDEIEFCGACDALTLALGGGALALPSAVSGAIAEELELSERAKTKTVEKAAKAKTKEQEREAARLQRESLKKERKETKERYREFAAVVAKEGPHRLFTQLGGAAAFADLPVGAPS